MILSDRGILKEIKKGDLKITPFQKTLLQPSSLDLRLGREFRIFRNTKLPYLDIRHPVDGFMELISIKRNEPLIIHPREFILGTTVEKIVIPNHLVGRLEGKSSLGRIGIVIHSTAGYVDPGFEGFLTLEISNLANLPIALYFGMRICQISFHILSEPPEKPYGHDRLNSKYQHQKGPTVSRIFKDFK